MSKPGIIYALFGPQPTDRYIGSTRKTPEERLENHWLTTEKERGTSKLYDRMKKKPEWRIQPVWGFMNISDEDLLAYEQKAIETYKTIEFGLNIAHPYRYTPQVYTDGWHCVICNITFKTNCEKKHMAYRHPKRGAQSKTDKADYDKRNADYLTMLQERAKRIASLPEPALVDYQSLIAAIKATPVLNVVEDLLF